jgi:hypothetical protein
MRQGFATLMVVGIAAFVGLYALWETPNTNDLYNVENQEFVRYISKYGKSYGTKEEFAFRANQYNHNM